MKRKLHAVFGSYAAFARYCAHVPLHTQLGFTSVNQCWRANPQVTLMIGGVSAS